MQFCLFVCCILKKGNVLETDNIFQRVFIQRSRLRHRVYLLFFIVCATVLILFVCLFVYLGIRVRLVISSAYISRHINKWNYYYYCCCYCYYWDTLLCTVTRLWTGRGVMVLNPAEGTDSSPPQRVQTNSVTHKTGKRGFAGTNGVRRRCSPLIPSNG